MAVFFLPILQNCWSRCAASCTRVCVHLFSLLLSHRGNLGSSFSLFPLFLTLSLVSADPVNLFKAYAQSFVLSSIRSFSMCIHSFLPLDISTTTTIIIVVIIILSPVELCKKKVSWRIKKMHHYSSIWRRQPKAKRWQDGSMTIIRLELSQGTNGLHFAGSHPGQSMLTVKQTAQSTSPCTGVGGTVGGSMEPVWNLLEPVWPLPGDLLTRCKQLRAAQVKTTCHQKAMGDDGHQVFGEG